MPPKLPNLEAKFHPRKTKRSQQGIDGSFRKTLPSEKAQLIQECFDFPKISIECLTLLTEAEKELYIKNVLLQPIREKRRNRMNLEDEKLIEDTVGFLEITEEEIFDFVEQEISENLKQRMEKFYENLKLMNPKMCLFGKYLEETPIDELQENLQGIAHTLTALVRFLHQNRTYILSSRALPQMYTENIFEIYKNIKVIMKELRDIDVSDDTKIVID